MVDDVIKLINDFVVQYQEVQQPETIWRAPVIGFADANDERFKSLKQIIGPNHALPQDIVPGAKSVIVFFLPYSEEIIRSNIPNEESSRAWDIANIDTNNLIIELNKLVYDWIEKQGYHASLLPPTYNYDQEKLISDWSHKSAAYIAGIGKFGVHHVLITEQGCCGRMGSIITDMKLEPTRFIDEEFCLFYRNGSCKVCIKRCPNHGFEIEESSVKYDRYKCNEQIYDKIVPIYLSGTGDACGKCMCNVPCATKIP